MSTAAPTHPHTTKGSVVSDSSRRSFLKYASLGTAAAGAAAVVPSLSGTADAAEPESSAPAHAEPFVAWVKNPQAGEIAVLVGDRELVYTDKRLAKKLAQAAARAQRPRPVTAGQPA